MVCFSSSWKQSREKNIIILDGTYISYTPVRKSLTGPMVKRFLIKIRLVIGNTGVNVCGI